MKAYPIILDIVAKEVLVIGGGRIATRKTLDLLTAGARVTVISPDLHPTLAELEAKHRLAWINKRFEPSDVQLSAFIVIAATNCKACNELVARSAYSHQLVNVVDDAQLGTFHVPAKLTRGKLTITVSTGGSSPALAKQVRDELALHCDEFIDDIFHERVNENGH